MTDGEVYEWGYTESDQQFKMVYKLPGKCVQVSAGLTFNLFLLASGEVWVSGQIMQAGTELINTDSYGGLVNLNEAL